MTLANLIGHRERHSMFKLVPPQDGGWSLTPMENLLSGLRNGRDTISMELCGVDGVVSYHVRTNNGDGMSGMLHSYFPQAKVTRSPEDPDADLDVSDWMHLAEDEFALVQSLSLAKESYLPLRVYDDRAVEQSGVDPLAGVIGLLSSGTRLGGDVGADRLGIRLVVRPAREDWNAPWQNRMQHRRDGDDRSPRVSGPQAGGPSMSTIVVVGALGGVGLGNWWLWDSGMVPMMFPFNGAALAAAAGGIWAWKKYADRRRPYMDEELVEAKLKSLGFWSELQLVRVFGHEADEMGARSSMVQLLDCLRSFDNPAGNAWCEGRIHEYSGSYVADANAHPRRRERHPFLGGSQILDWLEPRKAGKTALSAREVASLWHPPLGTDEMASMERTASAMLVPYLADLGGGGEDSGPLVGLSQPEENKIRLPESSIRKHAIILGRSGVGKSTVIKHVLAHKLQRKAEGKDNDAIVVIDPHADLVRDTLKMVPPSIADKVRLLDFGRADRVPGINLVDPYLFPDRDRCVDTIINTVKHLWEHWGGRLEDLLKRSLSIVYEYNSHHLTPRHEMMTMLDILKLLDDGVAVGQGRGQTTEMSQYQKHVLSRVSDPGLIQWFQAYLNWGRETRSEAVGPVHSRIGAYAANARASVIMGQRESTIMLSDVLSEGLVLLVATAQGTVGVQEAALMGGTMVSLVESALRDQEKLPSRERRRCLLVCDEFQTVTGADWEGMLAEIRKYGCSLMLATQSLARLDTSERKLKAGILGNVGVIIGYQMSAEDARIISPEMDAERVEERDLVNLDPHNCVVRINSETRCYPAFSVKTLPPPDDVQGSEKSEQAVLDASRAYTVDFQETRAKMNAEARERLGFQPVGEGSSDSPDAPAPDPAESSNPFNRSMEASQKQKVGRDGVKGLSPQAVSESSLSPEILEEVMRNASRDPALQEVINKQLKGRVRSELLKALPEQEEQVRLQVTGEVEEERRVLQQREDAMAAVVARAVDAAVLEAREEERARIGELAGMSSGGARNLGELRRVPGRGSAQVSEADGDG